MILENNNNKSDTNARKGQVKIVREIQKREENNKSEE